MSNKIKNLENELSKLEEKRQHYEKIRNDVRVKHNKIATEALSDFFQEQLKCLPDLFIKHNMGGSINFYRGNQTSFNGLVSINFRGENFRDPMPQYETVETSFYATSENSTEELERMVLIGEIGKKLLYSRQDLLNLYNELTKNKYQELQKLHKYHDVSSLDKSISTLSTRIKELKQQQKWDSFVENGLDFTDRGNDVWFDVKISEGEFNIKKAQFLEYSKTGNTCKVKITTLRGNSDIVIDRVNVDKLKVWVEYKSFQS